jgi:bifunctional non-homologous end joining protein LigD
VKHGLEGIVAKRADSPYVSGPSPSWIKAKRRHEDEFLVTRCRRDREGRIDALALATVGGRRSRGVVELGAWRVRAALAEDASARAGWASVEETIVVTVTYSGITSAGRLREANVKSIRVDALK